MARILIVDDSTVMRKNLDIIFNENGHKVIGEAVDGKQAIDLYSELKPDLVTMDITMPKLSGVEAVEQIIKLDPSAKIIMISALNQKQMVFEALKNGARHYVIKPIDPIKLIGIVNEVLEVETKSNLENIEEKINNEQGFSIDNINGYFNISFNKNLGIKDIEPLETAIRGLIFIKPLRLVFDFNIIENVSDIVLKSIIHFGKDVLKVGGSVEYEAQSLELRNILQEAN